MEKKRIAVLAVFVLLLFLGFMLYFIIYLKESVQGNVIKNNLDQHGCLVDSGFAWNDTANSCLKQLSNGSLIYQIADFNSCSDAGYSISENNSTKILQCHAPNGTIFSENSSLVNITVNNSKTIGNGSTVFVGNFNITNNTISNLTNLSSNITSNS